MRIAEQYRYPGADNLAIMDDAKNYNAFIMALINKYCANAETIVDFGAGIGTFAKQLSQRGRSVIAVEQDAHQRDIIASLGIPVVSDLSELGQDRADVIYCVNVLEHIQDDEGALRMLHSRLKPGGKLLIYVPAFMALFSSMDRAVGHVRRYRHDGLQGKMTRAGLQVIEWRYADSLGFLASCVFKLFGNRRGTLNRTALLMFDRVVFPASRLLDTLTSRWFGKNLLMVAWRRPSTTNDLT